MSDQSREQLDRYSSQATPNDEAEVDSKLDGMNRGPIQKIWIDVKALWAMVKDPNAAWGSKAIALGALTYLVSPFDIVPDVLPFVGLTDDVGVVLAAVAKLASDLSKYRDKNQS